MAETIKGINVVIGADTTALSKALSDVNKRSKDIQSELRQVDRLLKLDPSNTELIAQKQKLLADAIANTSKKLNQLKEAQDQVKAQFDKGEISEGQYRAFEREVISTEQNLKKLESQLESTNPEIEELGDEIEEAGNKFSGAADKIKQAGEKLTSAGKKLSTYVTAPIVGLGTLATMAAVDFESAFAGVRKTVDATEEEFAALEKGIRDMSKQMPASASDIAAVGEAAGQLGIETDNILKFTETMIGLGEATNLSAEEGATQFARFANIVGMSQGDFDKLGSSVVALGNNFATTEAEIVAMGMRLAGQGKQIGMSESQIMALAAAMSSVGIDAEAGGTAMSTSLKKMQTAVDEAGADLDGFAKIAGMTSKEFSELFKQDSASALTAFVQGLGGAAQEGENLTAILSDLGIKGIRESDALLRLAGASDVLSSALDVSANAWEENTALSDEVAQRYATTESQMAMLKNQIMDVAIQIGEILIPVLRDIISAIQPWIEKFSEMDEGTKKTIIVITGLAAAIGPLLIIVGQIMTAISALAPVFAALTGPIGLAVAAIVGIVAAIAILYNKNEEFREFIDTTWQAIKDIFQNVWQEIVNFVMPIIEDLSKFFKSIFNDLKEFWQEHGELIMSFIKPWLTGLVGFFKVQFEAIKMVFDVAWTLIKAIVKTAIEFVKMTISNVLDLVLGVFRTFAKLLKGDWKGAWDEIKKTAENIMNNIITFFKNIDLVQVGKDIIGGLIKGIGSMAGAVVDTVKDVANGLVKGIKGALNINSPSKVLEQIGEWTGEGLEIGLKKSINSVSQQASALADAAIPKTQQLQNGGFSGGSSVTSNISFEGFMSGAIFNVQSESQIKAIAREFFILQQQALRGAGIE